MQLCFSKMVRHSSRFRSGWGITVMWSQRTHTVMFWQNPSVKWPIRCQNFWAKSRRFDRLKNGFKKPFDRHLTDIKNLEILKTAKSYEKSSFSKEKLLFRVAAEEGFEPSQTESESVVLPLHNSAVSVILLSHRLATCIVYYGNTEVSSTFSEKFGFFAEANERAE